MGGPVSGADGDHPVLVDGDHHRAVEIGAEEIDPPSLVALNHLIVGLAEAVMPSRGADGNGGAEVVEQG